MAMDTVIIDTREQDPFVFVGVRTTRRKMNVGDYTLRGMEGHVAVERKSAADLWSTIAVKGNRERFEREFERAWQSGIRLWVLAETTPTAFLDGSEWSAANPFRLLEWLHSAAAVYGHAITWGGDKCGAAALTLAILRGHQKFVKEVRNGHSA